MPASPRIDVVAIGNALVDVIAHADEAFIEAHSLTKGSMMQWNKSANADKQAEIAAVMMNSLGGAPGTDAGDELDAFIGGLGMPRSLGAAKIGPEHFDRIANQAMGTPWIPRNPRPIPTPAEVREILELAA